MKGNIALPQADDPLGLAEPFEEMVSFGVADASVQAVQLPADAEAAAAQLAKLRLAMRQGQGQLDRAAHQIANLRRGFQSMAVRGVAFSAAGEPETPEAGLYQVLDAIEFSAPENLEHVRQKQTSDMQDWRKFVAHVQSRLAHPVQVPTQLGTDLVGYTLVDWSGDYTTVWQPDVSAVAMRLHRQAVDLVLAKIFARLRLVIVVSAEAGKLALQLAGPPGSQVLVIPAVWRFVREVLDVLRLQPEFQN